MGKKTKNWLIAAVAFILAGGIIFGGVMMAVGWNFGKLNTVKYQTKTYQITDSFYNIAVNTKTADVTLLPAEDGVCKVVCYEREQVSHSVSVEDGTLVIQLVDERKWYEHVEIAFGTPKVTVYVPQGQYEVFAIKATTGDVSVKNIAPSYLIVELTTGDVEITGVTCSKDISVNLTTGKLKIADVRCQNFISNGVTGDVSLKNVLAMGKWSLERTTGDIKFSKCDASELYIRTGMGDVDGSLLTGKVFEAKARTGDVKVPDTTTGGKCEVCTGTGDIKIKIA